MKHLIALSVGPIQEFISAARRTRDLWYGSSLLSDVSRAVAKSVDGPGRMLIFPASSDADNVANIIVAELDNDIDPAAVASTAKKAANDHWALVANDVKRKAKGILHDGLWDEQVVDVIEFYAAWVPASKNYRTDRKQLMRLLAGRKNTRDFAPANGHPGIPKSSLDGQRESVLKEKKDWPKKMIQQLRIRDGEQLDVVGLVKRLSLGYEAFPSVSRVAADPWLREHSAKLKDVATECESLVSMRVLHKLDHAVFPQFKSFPFDGTAIYPSRHHEWLEECGIDESGNRRLTPDKLKGIRGALAKFPEPSPYLAVLVADGDGVGKAIGNLESAKDNQDFSRTLATFSAGVKAIVEDHFGFLVYAGGDDVLAMVPVDQCLTCACELQKSFNSTMKQFGSGLTLSAGIAIAHFLEDLEDLLEFGRAAEKDAKTPDRNGLAVHLHKRGGSPIGYRTQWSTDPTARIASLVTLMQDGKLPRGLAYELRELAMFYELWPDDANRTQALQVDLGRVLGKKQAGDNAINVLLNCIKPKMGDEQAESETLSPTNLIELSKLVIIARHLAANTSQTKQAPGSEAMTVGAASPVQGDSA